jgi:hypothetical protein
MSVPEETARGRHQPTSSTKDRTNRNEVGAERVDERGSAAPAAPARSPTSVELIHGVQGAARAITPLHLWV